MNNEEQPQQQPDPYQIPGIVEQDANTNHSTDDMKTENSTINQFHNNQQPQEQDIVPDVSSAAGSQHVIQTSDSSNLQVMAAQQQQTYKEQQQMTQQNSETRTNSGQIQDISLNQQQQPDLGPSLGVYTPESSTNSVHSIHGGSFGNGSLGDQTPNANNSGVGNTGNNDQSTTSVVHTNNVMESPNSISSVDLQQQTMQQPPQHYNCSTGTGNNADMNLQQQHVSQQH